MKQVTDMTRGKPAKLILTFALPLMLTNIGQQLYMVVDSSIVGRGVGLKALAAVGSADWTYWLILWTVQGLTQGFAVFISRYFGKQDYRNVNKTIAMSAILCGMIGVALTVIGLFAAKPILLLLKTPDDIISNATIYLMTMIAGTLIVTAYNMASSILRSFGDGKSPLIAMLIAALLNVGLDLLFVLVFHWGVFGAAIASVTAQLFSFLFCLVRIKKIQYVRFEKGDWKFDGKKAKEMLAFGLPIALQMIVIAISGMVAQSAINLQGSVFVVGYTAMNKMYGLLESTAISLGMAASTFFAQNYGAGKKDRVRAGVRTAAVISVIMSVCVTVVMLVAGKYLLQMFIDAAETGAAESLQIGFHYLIIASVGLVILYLIHVYRNAMQALGNSFWSMISGFNECGFRILMAKGVVLILGTGTLYFVEPVAWIGALIFIMLPYYVYRKKLLS
ncbi:MAG: MATE family efflux transporter [Butyrivibrio sp.]|nr:MATE family efflux transporter [Acetatifactor muris]MCM1560910.1 MATE family efflux transporter [Butyrivibrio sp.]